MYIYISTVIFSHFNSDKIFKLMFDLNVKIIGPISYTKKVYFKETLKKGNTTNTIIFNTF